MVLRDHIRLATIMLVTRLSPLSGLNTLDLPLTPQQLLDITRGEFPYPVAHLLPSQREFLYTGLTPRDWDAIFSPGSSDADDCQELARRATRSPR